MATARITRKSIVGYGVNTNVENDERGNWRIADTDHPNYTGTIRQVLEQTENDPYLNSLNGGTFYSHSWFVKINGQWRKIKGNQMFSPADLLMSAKDYDWRGRLVDKFFQDSINVEIE